MMAALLVAKYAAKAVEKTQAEGWRFQDGLHEFAPEQWVSLTGRSCELVFG